MVCHTPPYQVNITPNHLAEIAIPTGNIVSTPVIFSADSVTQHPKLQ